MGTRSFIATKDNKYTYTGIYCHWDGYPEYMFSILKDNYNDYQKVDDLISMGSASSIKETIDTSEFHHRDMKEDLNISKGLSIESILKKAHYMGCEYLYLFVGNKWMFLEVE